MVDVVSHVVKQLLLLMFYSYLRLHTHLKVRNIFAIVVDSVGITECELFRSSNSLKASLTKT